MAEQGSDAQMTAEQRAQLEDNAKADAAAARAEEQATAGQPASGRDGPRYAHPPR